jgi:hypothetical protein
MGELRLYAIATADVTAMFGAPDDLAARLRNLATARLAPDPPHQPSGLLSKLGPIFKRPPGTPVIDPQDPVPADLDRLLAGSYVPAERSVPTWRLVELLIKETCWGDTDMSLAGPELDRLDFALACGGVPSAGGLRHLLTTSMQLPMVRPQGLLVGHQTGTQAMVLARSYHNAVPEIESGRSRERATELASWLDGFVSWTETARGSALPAPDLVGFWGAS